MAYNQALVLRIRTILGERAGLIEKKMFGGVGFILHGNLACGVLGDDLIVRVGTEKNDLALAQPFSRPFSAPGGKPMAGWILVSPEGWEKDQALLTWVEQGYEYAQSLPRKK